MAEVKFSQERPEIYWRLKAKFNVNWDDGIIIANGDTIYSKDKIPPQKLVHELVHIERQSEYGLDNWWNSYINDDDFRLLEEVLAYKKEYDFLKRHIKDREAVFFYLREMATSLSSSIYGSIIDYSEALKLIKK